MVTAIAYAVLALAVLSLIAWLVHGRVSDTQKLAAAQLAHGKTQGELERKTFELTNTQQALVAANKRATALEEVLQDEIESASNPELPPTDVRGRVLRIARHWAEAAAARSPLPAGAAGEAVPIDRPAEAPDAAGVRFDANGLMQPE